MFRLILVIIVAVVHEATAGRIMVYMPLSSQSMVMCFEPVINAMAERGHQVTVITPVAPKKTVNNVELIVIDSNLDEVMANLSRDILNENPRVSSLPLSQLIDVAVDVNDKALSHPSVKKYSMNPASNKFDIVIVSSFLMTEAAYYLAHKFEASIVHYHTAQSSLFIVDHAVGQPNNPAFMPPLQLELSHPMTFYQRVISTLTTFAFDKLIRPLIMLPKVDALLDKHFPGERRPGLLEMEANTSLAFAFGHPLIKDGMRPISPNFQYLGMMICQESPYPLDKDLEDFMASSGKHGVIYVSFGTVLKASEMSAKTRKILLNVFSRLDQKVLWKWETDEMEGKPDNVKLMKWVPQQSVLAHPALRLFVTHGGQSSCQEALCHQKPTVVVSVAVDQHGNGQEAERVGYGIWAPFRDLTEDKLYDAIQNVLNNPKYLETAKEHGSLVVDQINKPLDRAVWWLEFLLRHPGKNHFRSPVHDLTWYQYFLLDVIAFLLAIVAVVTFVLYKIIRWLCCSRKTSKRDLKKKVR